MLLDFLIVLACLAIGARVGGVGLGATAGLGLVVFVFGFGYAPGQPPVDVLLMILAVVTAAATLQASGGLDFLVWLAERVLSIYPPAITFVAPLVTYAFSFCAGTGHVDYSVLPIIAEVARRASVRPERPLSIGVIASQQAITASPISAATVAMVVLLGQHSRLGLKDVLFICIPATLAGILAGALSVVRMGDEIEKPADEADTSSIPAQFGPKPKLAVAIFLIGVMGVVLLGLFPQARPHFPDADKVQQPLGMAPTIQIGMLAVAGLILIGLKVPAERVTQTSIARAGLVALVSILGIAWLGNCFFAAHKIAIVAAISDVVKAQPWIFAFGLFALSILLYSQAATVVAFMPLGFQLGIPPHYLIAMFPAVNGYFFLPTYGTMVAAISFDNTGTTRIGKYVLNHSFMRPGMVAIVTSVATGLLIARLFYAPAN